MNGFLRSFGLTAFVSDFVLRDRNDAIALTELNLQRALTKGIAIRGLPEPSTETFQFMVERDPLHQGVIVKAAVTCLDARPGRTRRSIRKAERSFERIRRARA